MSMLRYPPEVVWQRLPLEDFRARFFIESYSEKLRMYTPHFYQARLMNVFGASAEMIELVKEYQSNDKNAAYLISSIEEVRDCWGSDPIAQELLSDLTVFRDGLKKIGSNAELGSISLNRLRALGRAILSRQDHYSCALVSALEDAVVGPGDLAQRERITTQIDRLTGLYVTHLLDQGYSPTYLFNRGAMFTRDNNYGNRSFAEQFRFVFERLQNLQVQFDVYYGIFTTKPSVFLSVTDDPQLEFSSRIPGEIQESTLEKFKKNIDIKVVAKSSIVCTDYVTAALRSKERLDRFLDTAMALEMGADLHVSAHCVTINRGPIPHVQALNVDVLLAFMTSEVGSSFSHGSPSIRQAFKRLDERATDQLASSLRYLRLARHSVSTEQKLLNLWIALESLFVSRDSTIIAGILEYVPHLYATAGLWRRVAYLRDLLVENATPVTARVRAQCGVEGDVFTTSVTEHEVFAILRDEAAAIELFDSLGASEHFKFKLMQVFRELKDNRAIAARLVRSEADVCRQLRRIYFLRNKIAHRGHYVGVRPQLVTHLLDYLAICYRAITAAALKTTGDRTYSVSELLMAARLGADVIAARASSKDEIATISSLVLNPVV